MKNPKVSILMGIYNCASTLEASIDSIMNQTFQDFEFIMCDDGSLDDTLKIAQRYKEQFPDKITILKNEKNTGLNYTLNKCLKYARGEYVARQDGDDISIPERLQKQLEVFDKEKNVSVVSSAMIYFDETGQWGQSKVMERPVKVDFIKGTPFCHAPSMIRKVAIDEVGGYSVSDKLLRVEDYHLWFKLYAAGHKGYNISTPLYKMFDGREAYSRRKYKYRINEAYVKFVGFRMLKMPLKYYIHILRPLLVGLMPSFLYKFLHKKRLNANR